MKLFADVLSQPSRAVIIFCRVANIPHELVAVSLLRMRHKSPEYTKLQPLQTVPAIDDDGTVIRDSAAILRYLSTRPGVPNHWYPKDPRAQARVDEYLHWHHANTRSNCSNYFRVVWMSPLFRGTRPDEDVVRKWRLLVENSLEKLEKVWLDNGEKKFLCGNTISVADIMACCELEQPSAAGLDVKDGRPVLTEYMDRVKKELNPHFDDVHSTLHRITSWFGPDSILFRIAFFARRLTLTKGSRG